MNERDFAIMEAARNEALDQYFKARPQLTVEPEWFKAYQKLFEAGFTRAWDKVAKLTTERDELRAKLEGGVRVEVYRDRFGELRAHQMKTSAGSEATLLIDDGVEI